MQIFRHNIFIRSTAGSLILGLALAAFSGTARAEERSLDYSSWVRLHLPGSAPESVQSALALSSESGAHSLDEFLETFLDEIRRSGSENDVAEWLYGKSVDHSIVRHDLRLRLMDVVSSVILQRSLEIGLRSPLLNAKQRFGHGLLEPTVRANSLRPEKSENELPGALDHRYSRFLVSEAQPQGP